MTTNQEQAFSPLVHLQETHRLCALLMKTPHYAKMGPEGVFAIVETAKSLGIDTRLALSGGLYYAKGRVEMSARMMNALIRSKGHSITKDKRSDEKICILHGRRSDNGDTWTECFSLDDAKTAGLAGNAVWKTYTRDMLFARALSRLARQLFPDVIGNVYVEGEISLDPNIKNAPEAPEIVSEEVQEIDVISVDEAEALSLLIGDDADFRDNLMRFLDKNFGVGSLDQMPRKVYNKVLKRINGKEAVA
jgi:hypothetical protein